MRKNRLAPAWASFGLSVLLLAANAFATVGPRIKVTMPADAPTAVSGQVYKGSWELRLGRDGVVDDFTLAGDGWRIAHLDRSLEGRTLRAGVYKVPFTATPTDASKPLRFTLTFDGRRAGRQLTLGAAQMAASRSDRRAVQAVAGDIVQGKSNKGGGGGPEGGAVTLRFTGRIVYTRPGSIDGDFNPIWFGATDEGVDRIRVEVMDEDDITDETIWSGYTNPDGTFDSGQIQWDDCDPGCDDPDIYLRWEANTDIVNVQDADDILESEWSWSTEDTQVYDDFTGSEINFGTWKPAEQDQMGALHIHNNITRSHRFILNKSGLNLDTPEVDVLWPLDDPDATAYYVGDDMEISITPRRTWRDSTHPHEYGHHFLESFAENVEPAYCNGICDGSDPCNPTQDCPNPSHCRWCPETDHDAWNEGWPNWLADIVTRDMPATYTASDGSPYEPLDYRDLEEMGDCCGDTNQPPFRTEGHLGALLRDIEDGVDIHGNSLQDDHNGDGHSDCLALGYDEIFTIAAVHDVTTPLQFIETFLAEYPQHTYRFYSTAFNVDPDYTTPFPIDTQPPGKVQAVTSPSHPAGVGGTLPCITVQWEVPTDDVTGACGYSFEWSTLPQGVEPSMNEIGNNYVEGSCITLTQRPFYLGDWYISIRAKDCYNHWSTEWDTFGPFTVTECNNNGVVDICETYCNPSAFPSTPCDVPEVFCTSQTMCGNASDCNCNYIPDECDIDDGTSNDCNANDIPDECEELTNWGYHGSESWHTAENWVQPDKCPPSPSQCVAVPCPTIPPVGGSVCIELPGEDVTVSYTTGTADLTMLACYQSLDMSGSASHQMTLQQPSFVRGDFSIGGRSDLTLRTNARFDIDGLFTITPGSCWLRGPGTIFANGGMNIRSGVSFFDGKDVRLGNNSNATATAGVVLHPGGSYIIDPGSTFDYSGSSVLFSGGSGQVVVDGTLVRSSGNGTASVQSPILNAGLVHNQVGELILNNGGTHTGDVLSDPGTLLGLGGTTDMEPGSTLIVDDIELRSGNNSTIRGEVNVQGDMHVSAGTWTFTNEANIISYGQNLTCVGTVHFESPAPAAVDFDHVTIGESNDNGAAYFDTGEPFVINDLNFHVGNINGSDPIIINDFFRWGPVASMFSGGRVTCNGPATIVDTNSSRSTARHFDNYDYATFLGAVGGSGNARITNRPTGTMELKGDGTGINSGFSVNEGLIVKTQGPGRSTLSRMTNSGTIRAETGEIYFYFGGENNGDIIGLPGTLLTFNGTFPMNAGSSLTTDELNCFNSTSELRGDVHIGGDMTHDGGTWTFTTDANVTSYPANLSLLNGSVHFEAVGPNASLDFNTVLLGQNTPGGKTIHFDTGQPVNINTFTTVTGILDGNDPVTVHESFTWGPVVSFFNGGTFTCLAPWTLQASSSSRSTSRDFINHGYGSLFGPVNLSGGADFINEPGGTVDFKSNAGGFGLTLTSHIQNNGTIVKSGGTGNSNISTHLTNAGIFEIQTGQVVFQPNYTLNFIQTGGATILAGGNLSTTGNPYNIQGGDVAGIGTIFGELNNIGGRVTPGLSAGTLTIDDDYTHGVGASLKVELGGLTPDTEHDQLVVTGTADIQGGTLNVVPADGFMPQVGQQFVILTAADVQGEFDQITGPGQYTATYNPTNVTITVDVIPCAAFVDPDLDQDCDVDMDDVQAFNECGSGPEIPYAGGCDPADFDQDGDTDQDDFGVLQNCISGENTPADPACETS